jgi:2-dehydropantoate 2-reductase
MSSRPSPRILLFGTGAIGAVYAFILSRAKSHVTAICRSNYSAVKSNGIQIESPVFGSQTFHPDIVSASVPQGRYDYVVVASKSFPRSNPAELLVPAITPGTTIVLIQNGIDIEAPYQERFPDNPILSCVVYLPVTQTSPGFFLHKEEERLLIGTYPATAPQTHKESAESFGQLIREGGATAEVHVDVRGERWQKLLLNASWNPMCALTRSRDAEFLSANSKEVYEPALGLVEGIMKEISLLAVTEGYVKIDEANIQRQSERVKARITGKMDQGVEPSMVSIL